MNWSQVLPPYSNEFDLPGDDYGWSHESLSGNDDWELGIPQSDAYSTPNAWVTSLDGDNEPNSDRVLITPAFDLSEINDSYHLSFYHRRNGPTGSQFRVEYTLDDLTWILLDNAEAGKLNWQGNSGFSTSGWDYVRSVINLYFLAGESYVKFRFRYVSGVAGNPQGWNIDNFEIQEDFINIKGSVLSPLVISANCDAVSVSTNLIFENEYSGNIPITTMYYLSVDSLLDEQDMLLHTHVVNISSTMYNMTQSVPMPDEVPAGGYFILLSHDALDVVDESIENDNVGLLPITIAPVNTVPYMDSFDDGQPAWKSYSSEGSTLDSLWEMGMAYRHLLDGAHSGSNQWHTSQAVQLDPDPNENLVGYYYLESPYIDLSSGQGDMVLNFWHKLYVLGISNHLEISNACSGSFLNMQGFDEIEDNEWNSVHISLSAYSSYDQVRFRFKIGQGSNDPGWTLDDVYVGVDKPDLSIEKNRDDRITDETVPEMTIQYYLFNAGGVSAASSTTLFYWSLDEILDETDLLLGSKTEQLMDGESGMLMSYEFVKPTQDAGVYYVLYLLDSNGEIDEMREYNNSGQFIVRQNSVLSLPYANDFEESVEHWRHDADLGADDWTWGTPAGTWIDEAFSGEKAFITVGQDGHLTPMSRSHLYTPVFDFTTLNNPSMEFDMKLFLVSYYTSNMKAALNMTYTIDDGLTWLELDTTSDSYNKWYHPFEYLNGNDVDAGYNSNIHYFYNYNEEVFATFNQYNGRDIDRNTHYVLDLDFLQGQPRVQFRFNLGSHVEFYLNDTVWPNEGVLIDNFIIRESFTDLRLNYTKALMMSSQSDEVRFFMHVKNDGNYVAHPAMVDYYVSADTLLDAGDFYLGSAETKKILPDMYGYINSVFQAPPNLLDYVHLIYVLDAGDEIAESDELNNIGHWPLALDSIDTYPYVNDFNDAIVDGWQHYSIRYSDPTAYRFRNMLAPGENIWETDLESGQYFTEPVHPGYKASPTFYLESPSFDFEGYEKIHLSFDLMCLGVINLLNSDGGNLRFSTDGGNNWTILTEEYGEAVNWYNTDQLAEVNDEPGWAYLPIADDSAYLAPREIDISFLAGYSHVVFQFMYKSDLQVYGSLGVSGMRLDNFTIEAWSVDLAANNESIAINTDQSQEALNVEYSVSCSGEIAADPTLTGFFWSDDNVYDSSDDFVQSFQEDIIEPGGIVNAAVSLQYPLPLLQPTYWLFYVTDYDNEIEENTEANNVGSFVVNFENFVGVNEMSGSNFDGWMLGDHLYLKTTNISESLFQIGVFNAVGQTLYEKSIILNDGLNVIPIDVTLATGVYIVQINGSLLDRTIKCVGY